MILAHLVRFVDLAAARPRRSTAHAARRAGTAHRATLLDLRVDTVKVPWWLSRPGISRRGAKHPDRAPRRRHPLETRQAGDAVGALGLQCIVARHCG